MTTHGASKRCTVSVCRDCCCGTRRKHPHVDHDLLVRRLREQTGEHGRVSVSTCLLACDRSNVVVVSPSPAGRRAGAGPVWLQHVLDLGAAGLIASWVAAGGPGLSPMPTGLRPLTFSAPLPAARRARRTAP